MRTKDRLGDFYVTEYHFDGRIVNYWATGAEIYKKASAVQSRLGHPLYSGQSFAYYMRVIAQDLRSLTAHRCAHEANRSGEFIPLEGCVYK